MLSFRANSVPLKKILVFEGDPLYGILKLFEIMNIRITWKKCPFAIMQVSGKSISIDFGDNG